MGKTMFRNKAHSSGSLYGRENELRRGAARRGMRVVTRLGLAIMLLVGMVAAAVSLSVLDAIPAFAATTTTCTSPASGGTATTFDVGNPGSFSVTCYGSGLATATYPTAITVATGSLPADVTEATTTVSTP